MTMGDEHSTVYSTANPKSDKPFLTTYWDQFDVILDSIYNLQTYFLSSFTSAKRAFKKTYRFYVNLDFFFKS